MHRSIKKKKVVKSLHVLEQSSHMMDLSGYAIRLITQPTVPVPKVRAREKEKIEMYSSQVPQARAACE